MDEQGNAINSGKGGATVDKKACITVPDHAGRHSTFTSVSLAAVEAHRSIHNGVHQSINGWRSLTFQGQRLEEVRPFMVNPGGTFGDVRNVIL